MNPNMISAARARNTYQPLNMNEIMSAVPTHRFSEDARRSRATLVWEVDHLPEAERLWVVAAMERKKAAQLQKKAENELGRKRKDVECSRERRASKRVRISSTDASFLDVPPGCAPRTGSRP